MSARVPLFCVHRSNTAPEGPVSRCREPGGRPTDTDPCLPGTPGLLPGSPCGLAPLRAGAQFAVLIAPPSTTMHGSPQPGCPGETRLCTAHTREQREQHTGDLHTRTCTRGICTRGVLHTGGPAFQNTGALQSPSPKPGRKGVHFL